MTRKNTMFEPSKYKKYSKIVSLTDPESARESVKELMDEFESAKTDDKRLRVARATQLASNRAEAQLGRENLSAEERDQFSEITKIYDKKADKMWEQMS